MKKLFKFIFKLIGFLLLLIIIALAVFIWMASDSSKASFDGSGEYLDITGYAGRSIYTSLEEMKESPTDESKKKIDLSLSLDELNNEIVQIAKSSLNENYDVSNPVLLEAGPLILESIYFEDLDGDLAAKARASIFGFYHTSVTLSGTPSLTEDGKLVVVFENFKVGSKIKINQSQVKKVMGKLDLSVNAGENFDVENLTFSYDFNEYLKQITEQKQFKDFFGGSKFTLTYANKSIVMSMSASEVFIGSQSVKKVTQQSLPFPSGFDAVNHTAQTTLTEEEFNSIVVGNLKGTMDDYNSNPDNSLDIGGYKFHFTLGDLYFVMKSKKQVITNVSINGVETAALIDIQIDLSRDSNGYIENCTLKVTTIKLGNRTIENADNFFTEITIPASTFLGGMTLPSEASLLGLSEIKLKDLVFDNATGNCDLIVQVV